MLSFALSGCIDKRICGANNVVRREKPETPNVDQSLLHCVAIRLLARESVQAIDDRLITLNAELLALHKAFDRSKPRRL